MCVGTRMGASGGMKRWFWQSPHLTVGFPQMPFTHSLKQAGEYPARPVFRFSHRVGNTSRRPAKRRRNRSILSPDAELLVTGAFSNEGWLINAADFGASWVSSAASSSKRWRRSKSNPANRARTLASPADVPFSSATYDFHQLDPNLTIGATPNTGNAMVIEWAKCFA